MKKIRNFMQLLHARWAEGFFVCVGLDSDHGKIPACVKGESAGDRIFNFNKAIIDATYEDAGAFKLNLAFYIGHGDDGIEALIRTVNYIRIVAPDVPIILDSKSADIDNTNIGYVEFVFNLCKADAITVHNYMGKEAMMPFLKQKDKGVIVLCKTSNKGSGEFQDLIVRPEREGDVEEPLYCRVARRVASDWNFNGNCALVVGATYPSQLAQVRMIVRNMPILLPGLGAQGGDVRKAIRAGMDDNRQGLIPNSSRGIIFKSDNSDFASWASIETKGLNDEINRHRLDDSLTSEEVLELFESVGAWLKDDHFIYTTFNHGSEYLNKDGVYPFVHTVSMLCRAVALRYRDMGIEAVAGPEKGGIIISQWTAYHLSRMTGREVLAVYAEKCEGGFVFKRGYDKVIANKRVLATEDIINTADSVIKLEKAIVDAGGIPVATCGWINRGKSAYDALAKIEMAIFPEADCPRCAAGIPVNTAVGKGAEYLAKKAEQSQQQ